MTTVAMDVEALQQLVSRAQTGDKPAADRLVREHEGWVRSVIFGVVGRWDLVEDIAQQVWTQVWERLGTLKDAQSLRSWLYAVARNAAIDAGQSRKRRQAAALEPLEPLLSSNERTDDPEQRIEQHEIRRLLLNAVEALPLHYREPFVLRHLEDWSYAQISEVLGLPLETVETRLVRARRLLKEALKGKLL